MLKMLLSALFFCLMFAPLQSQNFTEISRSKLLKIMEEEGYAGREAERENKVLWKIEGYSTYIFIAEDQESIQFYVAFSGHNANIDKVNTWNRTKKYSRSYLDLEGDPALELDLDFEGGINRERIVSFLKTCALSFRIWKQNVVD